MPDEHPVKFTVGSLLERERENTAVVSAGEKLKTLTEAKVPIQHVKLLHAYEP